MGKILGYYSDWLDLDGFSDGAILICLAVQSAVPSSRFYTTVNDRCDCGVASQQVLLLDSCGYFDGRGIVSLMLLSNFVSLWSNPQVCKMGVKCINVINGGIHTGWSPLIRGKMLDQRFVFVQYRASVVTAS